MSENRTKSLRFLLYVVTLRDSDFVRFFGDRTKLEIPFENTTPLKNGVISEGVFKKAKKMCDLYAVNDLQKFRCVFVCLSP